MIVQVDGEEASLKIAEGKKVAFWFKILTGALTKKRPLGKPRCRWEDNIRMDLKEIGINKRNWVHSAQNRDYWIALVNVILNL